MSNFDFESPGDFFDSRDVIERIEEIESSAEDGEIPEEDRHEYNLLTKFASQVSAYSSEWEFGITFVADDYFEEYAEEMAGEIGAIDPNAGWPLNRIDWAAAAEDLKVDYTDFDFDGTTYWARAE